MDWFGWLKKLAPIVLRMFPATRDIATPIEQAIQAAEESGADGPTKKAAVMKAVPYEMAVPSAERVAATGAAVDHVIELVNAAAKAPA